MAMAKMVRSEDGKWGKSTVQDKEEEEKETEEDTGRKQKYGKSLR